jgi:Xaa-Pro dipeptidase
MLPPWTKIKMKFAKLNQKNLISKFKNGGPEIIIQKSIIFLRAQTTTNRKWTDAEVAFRQESNFFWLTGCHEPDFCVTLDPATSKISLFLPEYEADHALWMGSPSTPAQVLDRYQVDQVLYSSELESHLNSYETVMVMERSELGTNLAQKTNINSTFLVRALQETRVFKTEYELEFMREAGWISAQAHIAVMKAAKQVFPHIII